MPQGHVTFHVVGSIGWDILSVFAVFNPRSLSLERGHVRQEISVFLLCAQDGINIITLALSTPVTARTMTGK
jgi:hypothetical protein